MSWKGSPSGYPRCRSVCFFIGTDLDKCSIILLAHQRIPCSEWVPSELEFTQLKKKHHNNPQVYGLQSINWHLVKWKSVYVCNKSIINVFLTSTSVWIIVIFYNSHSDGTHSLHRIHWWASDIMLNYSRSVLMKKLIKWTHFQQILILGALFL